MSSVVNCEEKVGKTVGKRRVPGDSLAYVSGLQRTLKDFQVLRIPKGVYRFCSHEEADQWLMDHLTLKTKD